MLPDLEFVQMAAPATDPALAPTPSALDLEEYLARPGAEARLRAVAEWELGASADLDRPNLVAHALTLLEQGRVLVLPDEELLGVDPTHPAGNALEDLGNLTDLVVGPEDDDGSGDDEVVPEPPRPTWIEIAVVDGLGEPVRNRPYRLYLPDGSVREGELDETGIIRFDDVDPGACRLELPTAHESEWNPAAEPGVAEEAA